MATARPTLDPQTENDIIDAIVALDWTTDIVTGPLRIIQNQLGVGEEQAIPLFLSFHRARKLIVCKPERIANNLLETGTISPPIPLHLQILLDACGPARCSGQSFVV